MTREFPIPPPGSQFQRDPSSPRRTHVRQTTSRTSVLSVISLVLGVVSLPLICACYLAFLTSIPAIVTGHIGFYQCRRANGALSGMGLSVAGLILGYFSLVLTSVLLMLAWVNLPLFHSDSAANPQAARVPGESELTKAELAITSDDEGYALGNSAEARALAREFADQMKALDEAFFTQTEAKLKLTGGRYVTWCELHEGKCAFVVHVPEYRKFEADAKETLSALAWRCAQQVVADRLEPEDELAVGLKGVLLYGAVMTGEVEYEDEDSGERLFEDGKDKKLLYPFFVADPVAAPVNNSSTPIAEETIAPVPLTEPEPPASVSEPVPDDSPAVPTVPAVPMPETPSPQPPSAPPKPVVSRIVPKTVEEAIEFLKGEDETRCQQAVSFLAYGDASGPDAAVADALFEHLKVEHGGGRLFVASALRKWASADDLPRLEPLLDDENVLVRVDVVETIGLLGTKEAAELLAKRLTVKGQASSVQVPLQKMGGIAEQPVLAQMRKRDLDIATQTEIILILAEVGGRDSFRALQRIASDQRNPLRFTAKSAAEKIRERLAQ